MSNNTYAHTNRIEVIPNYDGRIIKHGQFTMKSISVPGGLSFTSSTLFHAIEDIAAWQDPSAPTIDDPRVQALAEMLNELNHYGICGYWRLKAYMNYHTDAVQKARRLPEVKTDEGDDMGVAWLLAEESRFGDLVQAYFDVARKGEDCVRKERRKAMVIG
ncbi:hypothetical protein BU25DRAFT_420240 [Macroventuria anomochaeta]|uniref:Uncharacterized protein n=1 Tax=Macroventuria anomochaeta TaxID=301207 RepID=A0ACB6S5S4_9PLEO|nr:uncharacterized protein BU25DRAFT_420240 [Macroventuria anomochaeta]KAF2629388.1 hypothetical protein BU25DRAFT_420240 [Macroventuria anomochaeta]